MILTVIWMAVFRIIHKNAASKYWTSPGDSTPTEQQLYDHPWRKLSKLDEPDMRDTAGEVGTSS